jgi:shikimate kinase
MPAICLIGMPGVGKSKIGHSMASLAGYDFIDTDRVINRQTGTSLNVTIDKIGADSFLEMEDAALLGIHPSETVIISPGGSSVFCDKGMAHIATFATILYLADTLKNIERRIINLETRGIVGLTDLGGLDAVYEQRDPLYRKWAHHVVWLPEGFPFNPSVKTMAERLVADYITP